MSTTNSTPTTNTTTTPNRCAEGYVEESMDQPYEGYMCLNIHATIKPVSPTTKTPNVTCPKVTCPKVICPTTTTTSGDNGIDSTGHSTYPPCTTSNSIITYISGLLISIILSI